MSSVIEDYIAGGRVPWSPGYTKFKNQFIARCMADPAMMGCFRDSGRLPEGFAPRLDERVVEYPWTIARVRELPGYIFDAGSVYNCPLALDHPDLKDRKIMIYTLLADWITLRPNISYVFGDLRDTIFKDGSFDVIVCISTLEHVGMIQDFKAQPTPGFRGTEQQRSHLNVLREFNRLLKPSGHMLLTVPFGRYEDHGWLQQFDAAMMDDCIAAFGGHKHEEAIYRYTAEGWQVSNREECRDERYYNIHLTPEVQPDGAAAARALACLWLQK